MTGKPPPYGKAKFNLSHAQPVVATRQHVPSFRLPSAVMGMAVITAALLAETTSKERFLILPACEPAYVRYT